MQSQESHYPQYFKYWGKAARDGGSFHLLPNHCLDVAAVGHILLTRHNNFHRLLAKLSGLDEISFQKWMVFYLALHDLGKFSESFQNLRPDLMQELQNKTSDKTYPIRHDSMGYMLWQQQIRKLLQEINIIPKQSGSMRRQNVQTAFDMLALAVTGHHGTPPKEQGVYSDYFTDHDTAAACEFVTDIARLLLGNENTLPSLDYRQAQMASWWIAGFSVICDWLGSNSDYFSFNHDPSIDLQKYWGQALENAENAIAHTELMPTQTAPLTTLQNLFVPYLSIPTPLQSCCAEIPLSEGPQLFILEDVTGAGKTEAAIMLAHRLMATLSATGIYFGLPTMATANAMYERMSNVYQRLFIKDRTPPSLVLAHGARDLSNAFRQTIIPTSHAEEKYGDDTETAGAHCSNWLSDNRKKALLAEVGVGTIDQALLSILPSRHQSLRLLGLMGKVLIVDEVHACDAYMHKLLCALLRAHAAADGSAILLSATLPASQRCDLISAFNKGINQPPINLGNVKINDYPLLTQSNALGKIEKSLPTRESVRRTVKIDFVHEIDEVEERVAEALSQNMCVCWIRNTVNDARTVFIDLKTKYPQWSIDLFHARFAMGDRLTIENRIIDRFGKDSTSSQRRAQLLIATQVVEQSLDLDFDLMITDLAPVDLIVQRAGRLHRHSRDRNGAIIKGPDQRGAATMIIYGPDPDQPITDNWYSEYFKGASAVYENHGQLWLSAKLLKEKKGFSMPEDARELIEGVYANDPAYDIPDKLLENTYDAEGEEKAKTSLADLNALKLENGYTGVHENQWWDDALTPTRLGEATTTVYLARWDGKTMTPWISGTRHPWAKSAVQLRQKYIATEAKDETITQEIIDHYRGQLPAKGKWGVLLPLIVEKNGTWKGKVKNSSNIDINLYYSTNLGVILEKEKQQLNT